jgi:hypothetical protein
VLRSHKCRPPPITDTLANEDDRVNRELSRLWLITRPIRERLAVTALYRVVYCSHSLLKGLRSDIEAQIRGILAKAQTMAF